MQTKGFCPISVHAVLSAWCGYLTRCIDWFYLLEPNVPLATILVFFTFDNYQHCFFSLFIMCTLFPLPPLNVIALISFVPSYHYNHLILEPVFFNSSTFSTSHSPPLLVLLLSLSLSLSLSLV